MKKTTLCLAALLTLAAFTAQAQSPAPARGVFTEADDLRETAALRPAAQQYARYRVLRLDMAALRTQLAGAALEFTGGPGREVALPLPQGGSQAFVVFESPVLSPALAAQYPDIKTYAGKAASGPATVRFSVMNGEFSAVYFAVDAGREGYVQPVRVAGQPTAYLCYSTADVRPAPRTGPGAKKNACATADSPPAGLSTGAAAALRSTGGTLRTYRLAVAATTGFTALQGVPANANTQAAGLLGVVDYVNVLNGVCRRELSMDFTLVSGTTTITTPTNNPTAFLNGNDLGNLALAQAFMDAQIGNANYDIGHVFDATPGASSGGGVASLQSLCDNTDKAQGVSSFRPFSSPCEPI